MAKKPIRKDVLLIVAVLAVAAVLIAASRLMPQRSLDDRVAQQTLAPDAVEYIEQTPEPAAAPQETAAPEIAPSQEPDAEEPDAQETARPQQESAVAGPMPAPQTQQVRGYVVLTVNGRQYGDPIAMDRDKVITIRQDDGKINKIHITPEEVYMESSTCENQDCVGQGTVSLHNHTTRILGEWVICLPNAVTIELVPVDDAK